MVEQVRQPRRDQLAKFLDNPEMIRIFERLFVVSGINTPDQLELLFQLVEEVNIFAGTAGAQASAANDLATSVQNLAELVAMGPESASKDELSRIVSDIQALASQQVRIDDLISQLRREVEINATRPAAEMPRSFDIDYISFNENPNSPGLVRYAEWNASDDTLNIHHSDGVTQQVGQELYGRITNNTGFLIPNGSALGINPATNSYVLFLANGTLSPVTIVGVTTQDIPNGASGRITVWGQVRDIDTTGTPFGEVWAAGDILYVSTTIAGGFTKVKPTAPNLSMPIAQVLNVNASTGRIAVRPTIEQQLFYGSFIKTTDQSPGATNTATAITWDSATIANGVTIGAPASRIVCTNAGLYKFSASFQLTSSSASVKNVWLWFRKNGVDVPSSAMVTSLDSGTAIRTPSRSLFFSMNAGDYIELYFASDSTAMTIDNLAATAFAPAAPAATLTVNQEQQ